MKNIFATIMLGFVFFASGTIALNAPAFAQSEELTEEEYKELQEEEARKKEERRGERYKTKPLKDFAFPKNKRGCAKKSSMFVAVLGAYRKGEAVSDITDIRMIQPMLEDIYKTIRTDGAEKASLDNMKEYNKCMENAEPHPDEDREADMAQKFGACKKLNSVILDVLLSIKLRHKPETVMDRHEKTELDMSNTGYEGIDNPLLLVVGSLYDVAIKQSYEDAVSTGSNMSAACSI